MAQVVVTDAGMLFGGTTRALFIYLDYADVLRLHWTQRILTELSEALVQSGRKPSMDAALANERLMNASVETALVDQSLVNRHEPAMRAYVKDEGDAHVAACAYELVTGDYYPRPQPVVLSTRNLADYRIGELARLGITVSHPDSFLMSLPLAEVTDALRAWRANLESRPSAEQVLARLEKDGCSQIAAALRTGVAAARFEL